MRIPNPRLVRLGGLTSGAIVEPGDGEIQIPGVLQLSAELPSPLDRINGGSTLGSLTDPAKDSCITNFSTVQAGVVAQTNRDIVFLDRGFWTIDVSIQAMFLGTSDGTKAIQITLQDPVGGALASIAGGAFITGMQINFAQTYNFVFQRVFRFSTVVSATIAGDFASLFCCVNARRLT